MQNQGVLIFAEFWWNVPFSWRLLLSSGLVVGR